MTFRYEVLCLAFLAVVVSMACKESPKRPCTEPGAKCDDPQVVAVLELPPRPPAPPNTPELEIAKTDRFCSRIDPVRLANAIGSPPLTPHPAGETLMIGGIGPSSLGCTLSEGKQMFKGFDYGFAIEGESTLEEKDGLDRFTWEPYELLGKPARIGVATDALHIQVVVKGVRLHADLAHDKIPPPELEKGLVQGTAYIMELLPEDAASLLR
jgi:hypothetical protein